MQGKSGKAIVATKFAPFPWRFSRSSVVAALKDSLSRLGLTYVDLYQLHWCAFHLETLGDRYPPYSVIHQQHIMPFLAPRILESDVFPKFHLHGFLVCWWVVLVVLKNLSIFPKVVKSSVVAGQDCGAMKVSTNYQLLTLCTCSHLSPS